MSIQGGVVKTYYIHKPSNFSQLFPTLWSMECNNGSVTPVNKMANQWTNDLLEEEMFSEVCCLSTLHTVLICLLIKFITLALIDSIRIIFLVSSNCDYLLQYVHWYCIKWLSSHRFLLDWINLSNWIRHYQYWNRFLLSYSLFLNLVQWTITNQTIFDF